MDLEAHNYRSFQVRRRSRFECSLPIEFECSLPFDLYRHTLGGWAVPGEVPKSQTCCACCSCPLPQGFCCLMQLSTRSEDLIIDTLALRSHIGAHCFTVGLECCMAPSLAPPTLLMQQRTDDFSRLVLHQTTRAPPFCLCRPRPGAHLCGPRSRQSVARLRQRRGVAAGALLAVVGAARASDAVWLQVRC